MKYSSRKAMILVSAFAFVMSFAGPASAGMVLKLDYGSTSFRIADGSAGDLNGTTGAIVASQSIGSWSLNVTTGLSKPLYGTADSPSVDLNSVNVTGDAGGTMTIMLTDTDFTAPIDPTRGFLSQWGGTTDGSITLETYIDTGNTEFGKGSLLASYSAGTGAFSNSGVDLATITSPYSITLVATITHLGAKDVTSFDAAVKAVTVPEPGTISLMLLGLAGLAFRRIKA